MDKLFRGTSRPDLYLNMLRVLTYAGLVVVAVAPLSSVYGMGAAVAGVIVAILAASCLLATRWRWQYTIVHQVGSHIILQSSEPFHKRIVVSDHDPLRLGTFVSILRSVARHKGVTRDAIIATL